MVITLDKKERCNWISTIIKGSWGPETCITLMILEIQLYRSFLPNVITMVLKLGASLWLAMPIHWYALLFDLIFHFIMFSVSDNIYLNILSSSDLKLWISNWNNLQKYPGYSFFTKLHWCACGWAPKVVSSCIHNTLGKHTWTMHLAKILHTFCVEKWGMLGLLCQYDGCDLSVGFLLDGQKNKKLPVGRFFSI